MLSTLFRKVEKVIRIFYRVFTNISCFAVRDVL